ncbi:MAG: DsbA family protein, partial [Gemmatimonadota bacterium]|nr:DsbA family protein [Gemmatimonadota bacterium]
MTVPTWAFLDFTAPLCYVADAALRRLEEEGRMELHLRAAELFPVPEEPPPIPDAEWSEAEPLAEAAGLPLLRPRFRPRTAKAHEAVRLAGEHGLATPMRAAIFAAFFAEGRDIGRIDVLVELGERLGMELSLLKAGLD